MKTFNLMLGAVLSIFLLSCDNDGDNNYLRCDQQVRIDLEEYNSAPNHQLTINKIELNNNCLKIIFSSSGCSGNTWEVKLIDSSNILESYPPQRNLRLSLKNEELCDAIIIKELTFDISELQVDGNLVLLNITNSDDQILYEY